jgi:hypothetical protein
MEIQALTFDLGKLYGKMIWNCKLISGYYIQKSDIDRLYLIYIFFSDKIWSSASEAVECKIYIYFS